MRSARRLPAAVGVFLAAVVAAGCAAPDRAGPAAPQTSDPAPVPTVPSSAAAEPTGPAEPSGDPQPGAGPWPPEIVWGHLREAGITTVELGLVTLQIPAGFAQVSSTDEPIFQFSSPTPQGGIATVTVGSTADSGAPAVDQLTSDHDLARVAAIDVPQATSAAIGERVVGDQQTWVLLVVTADGQTTTATFQAPVDEFDDVLLQQSASSVVVAG